MAKTWVVVADSTRARIFRTETARDPLEEIETLTHPKAGTHDGDPPRALPGRSFDRAGHGRHAMESPTDPRKVEAVFFARRIAHHVDAARARHAFQHLILVAAPAMLGLLRDKLARETLKQVVLEVDKNLVKERPEVIRAHLPEYLPS